MSSPQHPEMGLCVLKVSVGSKNHSLFTMELHVQYPYLSKELGSVWLEIQASFHRDCVSITAF